MPETLAFYQGEQNIAAGMAEVVVALPLCVADRHCVQRQNGWPAGSA
jgi:hypothetical protein